MQTFIEEKREQIAELCRTHHVRRLAIFGSAVRDDFDSKRSDVDVRVEFDEQTAPEVRDYFGFQKALEEALGRNVDMFSTPTIENPYLRRIIEDEQVLLYAA